MTELLDSLPTQDAKSQLLTFLASAAGGLQPERWTHTRH